MTSQTVRTTIDTTIDTFRGEAALLGSQQCAGRISLGQLRSDTQHETYMMRNTGIAAPLL